MTGEGDANGAYRIIALNSTLRAECERVRPLLEEAKRPAERAELLEVLIRRAPQYGVRVGHASEWAAMFEDYLEALDGMPVYAVEDAFLRWNRGEGHKDLAMASFYPKSGQLYQLAIKARTEICGAAYRARKALEWVEAQPRKISDEERQRVAEGLKELAANVRPRGWPPDPRPTRTPQQMAAELRAKADDDVGDDDVGDVI